MSKIEIVALGGLNEDGKNMYVVSVDEDLFVFDAGLKYAEDHLFGIDYIIPDFSYLKENEARIKGVFLTHGHMENVGAVPELMRTLPSVKIYGTKFTLDIVGKMLEEANLSKTNLVEILPHRRLNFNEHKVFPLSLTHSIPDNVGYVLYTKDGAIFYTGNFVFDATM